MHNALVNALALSLCETDAPKPVVPEVLAEPQAVADIRPWRGRGNVLAAGTLLLDLMECA